MKKRNRFSRSLAATAAAAMMCASIPAAGLLTSAALAGDVDKDGKVGVTDVVQLQKYLLGKAALDSTAYTNADVLADKTVDVFDLAMLKRMLLAEQPAVSNTVYIHLKGTSISVEGDDNKVVQISGTTARITGSGIYYVDGKITDGQLCIETAAEDVDDVEIVLQDTTFTNSTKPAIFSSKENGSDKTKITLTGTNTMTDTAAAAYTDAGVIFSNNKLTFTKNSTGSLTVNSFMNAAINGEKKINLNGGTITIDTSTVPEGSTITPDADGINSDKNIEIEGATIKIDASGDGIKSDAGVSLFDGNVSIKAGADAVQAATEINISGGTIIASGDRGFRLTGGTEAGKLNITGGTVMATATDYQVNGKETIDMTGSTQTTMLFDMAAEWKKANAVTVNGKDYTANKKYDFVLISDSSLKSTETYKVAIGGTQANHEGDKTGNFKNTGIVTQYKAVDVIAGATVTPTPAAGGEVASIAYTASGVSFYDANGAAVNASAASNVQVTDKTYVTITKAGEYTLSGSCDNGQVKILTDNTAEPEAQVKLNLEGLTLSNASVAPIYVENVGDEAVISVKNGTTNTISDGTSHTDTYTNSAGETKTCSAAIYARDDLKIKGAGTLIVKGNTEDGIVSTNDLKIWNGNVTVTAADDGMRGDTVKIGDPADATNYDKISVTIEAKAGDGIKAEFDDTAKGIALISGGTVKINSYGDAIQVSNDCTVNGGTLDLYTYQGSGFTGTATGGNTGGWGGGMGMDGNANKTDISAKGIKSAGTININAGAITVDSSDDCLHTAGTLSVLGGKLKLSTADDALHSDTILNVGKEGAAYDSLEIYIPKCYEGVEGETINQNAGTVYIVSGDDGYNAAGGSDSSGNTNTGGWGGFPGGGFGGSSSGTMNLKGGLVCVNSASGDHDAFDSNGGINITGGFYIANGQEPVDADGTISNNGGNIITMSAGNTNLKTTYVFKDASGNVVASMVSAAGGSYGYSSGSYTALSGATISGGTNLATLGEPAIYANGTASGGTQLTAGSGGGNSGGPGTRPW